MAPALHRTAADFLLPDPATSKRRCGAADHVLPHTGPVTYGMADVAFTMKQNVQTDLETDRRVATTLAELIIGSCS